MSSPRITPSPAAWKRSAAQQATDPLRPRRVLGSLRTLFLPDLSDGGAVTSHGPLTSPPGGTGVERPVPFVRTGEPLAVERTFAFVDVCGFTAFCDRHGEHEAVELLTRFRSMAREVTGRRGVRISKWLGDGVMIVGTDPSPLIAAVAELVARFDAADIPTHAGIAAGPVLLFEGDDYIGRPVNLAARLCEAAEGSEILVAGGADAVPDWVDIAGHVTVRVVGIGDVTGVLRLRADDDTVDLLRRATPAA